MYVSLPYDLYISKASHNSDCIIIRNFRFRKSSLHLINNEGYFLVRQKKREFYYYLLSPVSWKSKYFILKVNENLNNYNLKLTVGKALHYIGPVYKCVLFYGNKNGLE